MNAKILVKKLSWIDDVLKKVWLGLEILMLVSTLLLQRAGYTTLAWLVVLVLLVTVCYPLYTFGYKRIPCFIANIVYTIFVLYVIIRIYEVLPVASFLLMPIIGWVAIATVYVGAQIVANKTHG